MVHPSFSSAANVSATFRHTRDPSLSMCVTGGWLRPRASVSTPISQRRGPPYLGLPPEQRRPLRTALHRRDGEHRYGRSRLWLVKLLQVGEDRGCHGANAATVWCGMNGDGGSEKEGRPGRAVDAWRHRFVYRERHAAEAVAGCDSR